MFVQKKRICNFFKKINTYVCAKIQCRSETIIVLTICRPGSVVASSAVFEVLSDSLEVLFTFNCPILLAGDLNLKLKNTMSMIVCDWLMFSNSPTWWHT